MLKYQTTQLNVREKRVAWNGTRVVKGGRLQSHVPRIFRTRSWKKRDWGCCFQDVNRTGPRAKKVGNAAPGQEKPLPARTNVRNELCYREKNRDEEESGGGFKDNGNNDKNYSGPERHQEGGKRMPPACLSKKYAEVEGQKKKTHRKPGPEGLHINEVHRRPVPVRHLRGAKKP